MDGRKNNKGTVGNRGGRKPKADEQKLIEHLSPIAPEARRQLAKAVKAGEQWAVKLFFEYYYGKPKQTMDVTTQGDKINAFDSSKLTDADLRVIADIQRRSGIK